LRSTGDEQLQEPVRGRVQSGGRFVCGVASRVQMEVCEEYAGHRAASQDIEGGNTLALANRLHTSYCDSPNVISPVIDFAPRVAPILTFEPGGRFEIRIQTPVGLRFVTDMPSTEMITSPS